MASYAARVMVVDGIDVIRLSDATGECQAALAPSVGNIAYEFSIRGKNVLWFPYRGPAELRAEQKFCGIPFLAPWANRIDGDAYWVNGKEYVLNAKLDNVHRDANGLPMHGLLRFSPHWELVLTGADAVSASATSRLEFFKHPELMAQFPFAHTITMTHRLTAGSLEVETVIDNLSAEPIPVAIGFHPYFRLHDAPRDDWTVHLAAARHLELDRFLIPTGESKPVVLPDPFSLRDAQLDDGFAGLIRDADGAARFHVQGTREKLTVEYGPKYRVAVVYAPRGWDFICFEPMSAPTNAFNLAHGGVYVEMESIPPGGQWKESFWVTGEGF